MTSKPDHASDHQPLSSDQAPLEKPARPRPRRTWLQWLKFELIYSSIFFVLYTLSIGPMFFEWQWGRQGRGSKWIAAFYEPLRILGEFFTPFGEFLNWYIRFWIL